MTINKKEIVFTSLVTLSPIAIGLYLYPQLPEKVAVHFNYQGVADTYYDRVPAIVILPIVLLVTHMFIYFITSLSLNTKPIHPKMWKIIVWMIPVISVCVSVGLYVYNLKLMPNGAMFIFGPVSLLFIVIGNYLPKCEHNYFVGVKTPWALLDEKNWRATHRFSGPLWVVCGLLMLIITILQISPILFFIVIIVMTGVPFIYSYWYYQKQKK
ncbi:MAG: SdpI family protein [Culicoidibacterales bacterium]